MCCLTIMHTWTQLIPCMHVRRQEEQTVLKGVVEFLGLGTPTHEQLTAMGHVKANRGHAENAQYPGYILASSIR